jgi:spermidine/putrescine transport system ATP-binding protein
MIDAAIALKTGLTAQSAPDVELKRVYKMYGPNAVVQGVDLQVFQGELFTLLGPSGCGKTTMLRMIAGFEEPSAGEVFIAGQPMNGVPPYRRLVNTVFQSYALFGHMTVSENVAFGMRVKGVPKPEISERVREALLKVRLEDKGDRYPRQLSGGQQQRVALARALVNRPKVVLLDEPLGALDFKLRKELQVELSLLQQETGITFIMVTHDQDEALSISSRIAVVNKGRIEQIGTPMEIYDAPTTRFVAEFVGETNVFECRVIEQDGEFLELRSHTGLAIVAAKPVDWQASREVLISVRPEKMKLSTEHIMQPYNTYRGILNSILYLGDHSQYFVDLYAGDSPIPVPITLTKSHHFGETIPPLDSQVYISWLPEDCFAIVEPHRDRPLP